MTVNPDVTDNAPLLMYIQRLRLLHREVTAAALLLAARAKSAQNDYGARHMYVQHLLRQAQLVAAAAELVGQTLRGILKEKKARLDQLARPRNGNAAHEVAVDITSAMQDHHNIIQGR